MVRNLLARTWTLPTDADITDDRVDDGLDMDRWENDGGRSQDTTWTPS